MHPKLSYCLWRRLQFYGFKCSKKGQNLLHSFFTRTPLPGEGVRQSRKPRLMSNPESQGSAGSPRQGFRLLLLPYPFHPGLQQRLHLREGAVPRGGAPRPPKRPASWIPLSPAPASRANSHIRPGPPATGPVVWKKKPVEQPSRGGGQRPRGNPGGSGERHRAGVNLTA